MITLLKAIHRILQRFGELSAWRAAGLLTIAFLGLVAFIAYLFLQIAPYFGRPVDGRDQEIASLSAELRKARSERNAATTKIAGLEASHAAALREIDEKRKRLEDQVRQLSGPKQGRDLEKLQRERDEVLTQAAREKALREQIEASHAAALKEVEGKRQELEHKVRQLTAKLGASDGRTKAPEPKQTHCAALVLSNSVALWGGSHGTGLTCDERLQDARASCNGKLSGTVGKLDKCAGGEGASADWVAGVHCGVRQDKRSKSWKGYVGTGVSEEAAYKTALSQAVPPEGWQLDECTRVVAISPIEGVREDERLKALNDIFGRIEFKRVK